MSQQSLRTSLRTKRKSLSKPQRYKYHKRILRNLLRCGILRHQRFALYYAFDGEVDTTEIIKLLQCYGKELYVPKLCGEKLVFTNLSSINSHNIFGIVESRGKQIFTKQLTCVITPLVGFDVHRNRIGMGRGYYDKSFAFINIRNRYTLPSRIGVAYEVQRASITPSKWDVKLSRIVTEQSIY